MAKGSAPALKWSDWSGPRECAVCGEKLTLERVGEFRTYYQNGKAVKQVLWCVEHRGGKNG